MKTTGLLLAYLFVFILVCNSKDIPRSEVIKSTIHFQVKGDRLIRTDSIILQINERMGDNDTEIGFVYSKGDKIDILYAQIEDLSGNIIRKLKKSEVKDQSYISEISFYEDDFIKSFDMKHSNYPYRVSFAVRTNQSKFFHIFELTLPYQRKPVREAVIIVDSPADRPIKYKQLHINGPEITAMEDTHRHIWQYSYEPLAHSEINPNFSTAVFPRLTILPLAFDYGKKGSWESWSAFGDWIYRLNFGSDILPESERNKVDQLLKGIINEREKARILYRYLQENIRYVNVKIDIGGFRAYPADYVCKNRYGDCKALTNYMLALLKYAGIKSYYTLIHADKNISEIDPEFPSQEFNHVILTVPLANDTIFLECTNKNLPFGYIHTGIQGRKALLVDEDKSHLISVPTIQPEQVLCVRNFTVVGNRIELKATSRGEAFEESLYLSSGVNKNVLDRYLRNTILSSGSYSLQEYEIDTKASELGQIGVNANLRNENMSKRYGNNMVLAPFPLSLPNYETPEKRTLGVKIDIPLYCEDVIIYKLQENEISKVPEAIKLETEFGLYCLDFSVDGHSLIMKKSLLIRAGKYHLGTQYKKLYDFVMTVKNHESKNIYIEIL